MDINRRTAYHTLMDVETKNAFSNIATNHQVILHKPTNVPFVRELVYGVLENKMLLDYVINELIPGDVDHVKKSDLTILRMGIYQLAKIDSVPEYAAVNESVQLAKKFSKYRFNPASRKNPIKRKQITGNGSLFRSLFFVEFFEN